MYIIFCAQPFYNWVQYPLAIRVIQFLITIVVFLSFNFYLDNNFLQLLFSTSKNSRRSNVKLWLTSKIDWRLKCFDSKASFHGCLYYCFVIKKKSLNVHYWMYIIILYHFRQDNVQMHTGSPDVNNTWPKYREHLSSKASVLTVQ